MVIHKRPELDTINPPGQIVNVVGEPDKFGGRTDKTLQDYLDRKYSEEKKLTFDEWLLQFICGLEPDDAWWWKENGIHLHNHYDIYKVIWKAAQENK